MHADPAFVLEDEPVPLEELALAAVIATGVAPAATRDPAYARRVLLRSSDFPPGWTAQRNTQGRPKCGTPSTAGLPGFVTVRSPRFQQNANTVVQSRSYVLPMPGHAVTLMRRWAGLSHGACLRTALATIGRVTRFFVGSKPPLSLERRLTARVASRM
jgi:hypothetical protein